MAKRSKGTIGTSKSSRRKAVPEAKDNAPPALPSLQQKHKAIFLASLARHAVVAGACEDALISRTTAYQWRKDDPEFAAGWEAAYEAAIDRMEQAAVRRAVEGIEEPVFGQHGEVGRRRRYSDTLLMFILKRHRPEYRDNTTTNVRHSGGTTTRIVRAEDLSDDELARIAAGEDAD